jgi:hypothetical protein
MTIYLILPTSVWCAPVFRKINSTEITELFIYYYKLVNIKSSWQFSIIFLMWYLIHSFSSLTTGPMPLPKRTLHIVRSRASSFKWEYPLLSLRLSNSFLRLLPCLHVTSIPPCSFPSITRRRRQSLRKMWPIQLAFRLGISCRIFLCSLTLSNTS